MFDLARFHHRLARQILDSSSQAHRTTAPPPAVFPQHSHTIFTNGVDAMPFLDQGRDSACGTTSLAMILGFLGKPTERAAIDREIRRMDTYTSPGDLVEYARDRGVAAQFYNKGSWDELKRFVDRGIPTQVLFSPDGSGDLDKLHYVAVVGYVDDPVLGEAILYHDSNHPEGFQKMSRAEFERKWLAPKAGFDNFFIAYAPAGTPLAAGRDDGIEGTLAAAEGGANFFNGLDRVQSSNPFTRMRGLVQMGAGAGQFVAGTVGGYAQSYGRDLRDAVEGVPVLEQLLQPVGHLVGGVGAMAADLVNGVAEAGQDLGEGLDKLGRGDLIGFGQEVGEAGLELVEAGIDTVGDGLKSIGGAVVDLFDW